MTADLESTWQKAPRKWFSHARVVFDRFHVKRVHCRSIAAGTGAAALVVFAAACGGDVPAPDVDATELAVFQAVVEAGGVAAREAESIAPTQERFYGPSPIQKGAEKRDAVVSRYMDRALVRIATDFGLSRTEVRSIHETGLRDGWLFLIEN